ncbi:MAG TPA: metal-dependent hydrolase, partial [Flavobacteriaceae bacterium]|nr:metal-dependent hydrolase [Flavobacteriaceae bacterium]
MDSLTQIVLGAAVGEAVLGRKIGNKAIIWGAISGTIPDLDVLSKFFTDTVSALEIHRGLTHSLFFVILFSPLMAWLMGRIYKFKEASFKEWTLFYFLTLVTHPLLDAHTTWGTKFFWPLDIRLAYKNIFVVDPIYTVPLLVCVIIVLFYKRTNFKRRRINQIGLIISTLYLVLTIALKQVSIAVFSDNLQEQQIAYKEFTVRPTPLNSILWAANVETDDTFLIGYYSLMDNDKNIIFTSYPKNHELLGDLANHPKVKRLIAISEFWYTITKKDNKLYLNDLRFGLLSMKPNEDRFVFSYLLEQTSNNQLVITESKKKPKDGQVIL